MRQVEGYDFVRQKESKREKMKWNDCYGDGMRHKIKRIINND